MSEPEIARYCESEKIDSFRPVYDEVIRLGANRPALAKLSRLTSYEQFFYFMENLATGPTT